MSRPIAVPDQDPFDDLSSSHQEIDDSGLSLEELGRTYAELIARGDDPYVPSSSNDPTSNDDDDQDLFDPLRDAALESDACPVTPKTILEAILFVGHPDNKPLSSERIAGLMRGVRPAEIEQLVDELNRYYLESQSAMHIVAQGGGFVMQLAADLDRVRDRLYGRIKETRLNQDAIDCLALVAYQPGITRDEIERQWNRNGASVLATLVRRNLLELKKAGSGRNSVSQYYPTERLLNLFGLASLDELPQVEDMP